jgi:NAD(P)-dependent dehydrogenase (short-subunit alcohol dehydrogenase family)
VTVTLGRYRRQEEIAAGIAFLAREEAALITGHNLVVGGGRAML